QLAAFEATHAGKQFLEKDHHPPIARRGSVGWLSAQPLRNSASAGSSLAPIITFSVTYWSPVVSSPRRFLWTPLARSRSLVPVSEPWGIVIVTGPVTVGT